MSVGALIFVALLVACVILPMLFVSYWTILMIKSAFCFCVNVKKIRRNNDIIDWNDVNVMELGLNKGARKEQWLDPRTFRTFVPSDGNDILDPSHARPYFRRSYEYDKSDSGKPLQKLLRYSAAIQEAQREIDSSATVTLNDNTLEAPAISVSVIQATDENKLKSLPRLPAGVVIVDVLPQCAPAYNIAKRSLYDLNPFALFNELKTSACKDDTPIIPTELPLGDICMDVPLQSETSCTEEAATVTNIKTPQNLENPLVAPRRTAASRLFSLDVTRSEEILPTTSSRESIVKEPMLSIQVVRGIRLIMDPAKSMVKTVKSRAKSIIVKSNEKLDVIPIVEGHESLEKNEHCHDDEILKFDSSLSRQSGYTNGPQAVENTQPDIYSIIEVIREKDACHEISIADTASEPDTYSSSSQESAQVIRPIKTCDASYYPELYSHLPLDESTDASSSTLRNSIMSIMSSL
jgi:hypothetical protein